MHENETISWFRCDAIWHKDYDITDNSLINQRVHLFVCWLNYSIHLIDTFKLFTSNLLLLCFASIRFRKCAAWRFNERLHATSKILIRWNKAAVNNSISKVDWKCTLDRIPIHLYTSRSIFCWIRFAMHFLSYHAEDDN